VIDYLIFGSVGYFVGSVPFGLLAGKVLKRVDVREYGSGSTGSTNVARTIGAKAGAVVLLLDMCKSAAGVLLARALTESPGIEVAVATTILGGHIWPVFIGFRGGKGTAPGWGGLIAMSPVAGVVGGVFGVGLIASWRYVSVGSLVGTLAGVAALIVSSLSGMLALEYIWYGLLGTFMIIARHRENIQRLLRGEERKLGQSVDVVSRAKGGLR
jgi:glycerol-3-phosphate acyltransferase PlsY